MPVSWLVSRLFGGWGCFVGWSVLRKSSFLRGASDLKKTQMGSKLDG